VIDWRSDRISCVPDANELVERDVGIICDTIKKGDSSALSGALLSLYSVRKLKVLNTPRVLKYDTEKEDEELPGQLCPSPLLTAVLAVCCQHVHTHTHTHRERERDA
jgi:hypothetical protein